MTLMDALHRYAAGLRVIGSDESAENAWRSYLADMDANLVAIIAREDYEWLEQAMRHSFEVGWHAGLKRANEFAMKILEDAR